MSITYHLGKFVGRHPAAIPIAVAACAAVYAISELVAPSPKPEPRPALIAAQPKTPDPAKEREFQSMVAGAMLLKRSMKKPEAFELLDAFRTSAGVACYQYRSRNSFNDVREEVFVIGGVGKTHAEQWNKSCLSGGTDYTYVRSAL